jgi:CBS domain-containing protein
MEQRHKEGDSAEARVLVGQTVPREAVMRVGDLMTQEVSTLAPTSLVQEAMALLAERRFHHLLITEADGRLVGVLSDRDVLRFLARHQDASATPVAAVMNRAPIVVHPASFLTDAIRLLVHHRFNSLPVVDESNHVCGILTTTDLLHVLEVLERWFEQGLRPEAEPKEA